MPHKPASKMAAVSTTTDSLEDVPDNISISFLPNHRSLMERIIKRGLNYYLQGYVHQIKVHIDDKPKVKVVARCWRSMRKNEKPHTLHIEILKDIITESYCSCKVGLTGHCSHIIGLVKTLQGLKLHNISNVPDQLSCTSVPQQWHVPRGEKIEPVPLNHVVVAKACETRKRKPVLCQVDTQYKLPEVTSNDIEQLKGAKGTPLEYLLSSKRPLVTTDLGQVQLGSFLSYQTRNLKSMVPVTTNGCGNLCVTNSSQIRLPEKFQHLISHYTVTDPQTLEQCTRNQAMSETWHQARQNRLTASNFGDIMLRKSPPNEKLLSRLFSTSKDIHAPSISYGKRNESKAKSKYLAQFPGRHIHECGFVVNNEFPFLGATPDGKLCDNGKVGIIEIKCPYSARDLTVADACCQLNNFFLHTDQNGQVVLKSNHAYYAQVQGQLMITGSSFCDFIVYCPNESDLFVQRVEPDVEFMTNMLNVLASFFEQYAHPFLHCSHGNV
ncbi:uncharacterized protein LOC132744663 [Ruditapes philippinarum]|uniref:uncharacterized protein LOC132744663 n=1 Tax=Ruditapes philippinarum TaxID=129788 RepID=UPI00295AEAC8|nr:uncharacterized protein LOC132744663 [Ruditapes philippinarum]